jgi:hypothetical protein
MSIEQAMYDAIKAFADKYGFTFQEAIDVICGVNQQRKLNS